MYRTLNNAVHRERLVRRLRSLEPDQPRRWGRMSCHEMVCHLTDAFEMGLGERPVQPVTPRLPRPLMKVIAFQVPLPWPRGFPAPRELRQRSGGGTPPVDFRRDLAEAERAMHRFAETGGRLDGHVHPIFGPLSTWEWLRWAYLHTDHHLRQFNS